MKLEEIGNMIFESKATESEASSILSRFKPNFNKEEIESILSNFKSIDTTPTQSLLPIMAHTFVRYYDGSNSGGLFRTFKEVCYLIKEKNYEKPKLDKNHIYTFNNKAFYGFTSFGDYILDLSKTEKEYKSWKKGETPKEEETPEMNASGLIWPLGKATSKIFVYDGNDVKRCEDYNVMLTGKELPFCIGKPNNINWAEYRASKSSNFYYVLDNNYASGQPLHVVVVDHNAGGFRLSDLDNSSIFKIDKYGTDFNSYFSYLRSEGVPVDKLFRFRPTSMDEKLKTPDKSVFSFKSLTFPEKTKYISYGHQLSDEQFEYLWNFRKTNAGKYLINQYLNGNNVLTIGQLSLITE